MCQRLCFGAGVRTCTAVLLAGAISRGRDWRAYPLNFVECNDLERGVTWRQRLPAPNGGARWGCEGEAGVYALAKLGGGARFVTEPLQPALQPSRGVVDVGFDVRTQSPASD